MKRFSVIIAMFLLIATTFATIPVNAASVNEEVLKYTPKIDGKIDAAYLQSFYINHDWPSEKSSANYWGVGKFAFTDIEKDAEGNDVEGSIGYNTAYGWDLKATTYFLWDDDNLYFAVKVTDDDYGCIDDAHYQMSVEDSENWGPWLQDGISVSLGYKGLKFGINADRAGRYASVFREPNYGHQVWCDMYSWFEHQKNKDAGYFVTTQTSDGYIIELKVPVSVEVKDAILKNGGNFKYGISVVDAPSNAVYGLDQGKLEDGEEVEGYNFEDFMLHSSGLSSDDSSPSERVKLVDRAPDLSNIDIENDTEVPDANADAMGDDSGNQAQTGTNTPAADTGDIGIAVAATALIAGASFIIIRKRK